MTAWLVLEAGLLIRDRIRGKGSAARDHGTLWLNIVIITAAVVAAGLLTGAVNNAGPRAFGSTGLGVAGLLVMWTGLAVRIWAIVVLGNSFRTTWRWIPVSGWWTAARTGGCGIRRTPGSCC